MIVLGAGLRLWQYLANSSLWVDEAAIARNIVDRPVSGLFQSLDYAQTAPLGFLLIEKGIISIFGTSEYALRAFPLASGLLGLVLFRRLAVRILTGWAIPYAVGLFALGMPLIYFSAQVKQYSSDVAAAMLLLLIAIDLRARPLTMRRAWLSGLAGASLLWFSQPGLFVLAGIGIGLAVSVMTARDARSARMLAMTGAMWAASAAAVVFVALRTVTPDDQEYFQRVWADGFMPMPPRSLADTVWVFNKLTWAFGAFAEGVGRTHGGLNYRWSILFVLVMLIGMWALWKHRRDAALFLGLPILLVAGLSAAHVYPFSARLLLFLQPSLLLATAAGSAHVVSALQRRVPILVPVALAILGGSPVYAIATSLPPFWLQHIRPLVHDLRARLQPADAIYVYYGAGQAIFYYARRYDLPRERLTFGPCAIGNPREYLRQVDRFRGRDRVWVVVSHAAWNELAVLLAYLDRIGRRVEGYERRGTGGKPIELAALILYDLSAADRLASSTSESFPIAENLMGVRLHQSGCYGVAQADKTPGVVLRKP